MDPYMDGSVKTAIFIDDQIFAVISPTGGSSIKDVGKMGGILEHPHPHMTPFVADIDHSQSKYM